MSAARAAQTISQEIENPWGQAHSAFQLAKCALDVGVYAEALAHAQHGALLAQARKMPLLRLLCLALQGAVQRTLGMLDIARETHQAAAMSLAEAPALAQALAPMIGIELVADHAAAGDWQAAWTEAQPLKGVTLDRSPPYTLLLSFALVIETRRFCALAKPKPPLFWRALASMWATIGVLVWPICAPRQYSPNGAVNTVGPWPNCVRRLHWPKPLASQANSGKSMPGWGTCIATRVMSHRRKLCSRTQAIVHVLASKLDDERLRTSFLTAEPVQRLL